jgi:hypothetical protein
VAQDAVQFLAFVMTVMKFVCCAAVRVGSVSWSALLSSVVRVFSFSVQFLCLQIHFTE